MFRINYKIFNPYDSPGSEFYQLVNQGILYLLTRPSIFHYEQYLLHIVENYYLYILLCSFYVSLGQS
jgi:hypothetical protein